MFQSISGWKIWLVLWQSCPSNCYNCNLNLLEQKFFSYENHKENIEFIWSNFSDNFSIFLSGVENIFHPDIEKFIEDWTISKYEIYIHVNPIFEKNRCTQIKMLSEKYPQIYFDTWYTVRSSVDLVWIFQYINFLDISQVSSLISLFIDLEIYGIAIKRIFSQYNFSLIRKETDDSWVTLIFVKWWVEVSVIHQKKQVIKNNFIHELWFTSCMAKKSFSVVWDTVFIEREVEFHKDGTMKFHLNPYCNKGITSISNINKEKNDIIRDFQAFDLYLEKFNSWDMKKNCIICMWKPYIN